MKFRLVIDPTKPEEVVVSVHRPSRLTQELETLVMQYAGIDSLTAYTEEDLKQIKFSQIECITIQGGKTYAIDIHGKQYRIKQRLYELEALLPSYFIRINKSALANIHRIERFSAAFSGAVDAVFQCGYREYVSRRCFAEIKRRLEK